MSTRNTGNSSKSKSLLYGTLIYAIGNFGTKILSFLIVPLYTFYIAPEELGTYDLLMVTVNLISPFITLEVSEAAYRWIIEAKESVRDCITTVYKFLICNCLITIGIIYLINCFIPIVYCNYFIAILILSRILESLKKMLRGLQNKLLYALSGILYTALFLIINVIKICVYKEGIEAIFISGIISHIITIFVILIFEKKLRQFTLKKIDLKLLKKMLRYSTPLISSMVAWWIMNLSDRYVIQFFLGSFYVGIYAVACKFPTILSTIFSVFNSSWQDTVLKSQNDSECGDYYSKVFSRFLNYSFTIFMVLASLTRIFVPIILGDAYKSAVTYMSILYFASIFQGLALFFSVGYLKNKYTKEVAKTNMCGAVINLVLDLILIKPLGVYAACISTCIGYITIFLIRLFRSNKIFYIKINKNQILLLSVLSLGICICTIRQNIYVNIVALIISLGSFFLLNRADLAYIFKNIYCKIMYGGAHHEN